MPTVNSHDEGRCRIGVLRPEPLSRDRWFNSLPTDLAVRLLALAVSKQLCAGQRVCLRGQRSAGMFFLLDGEIHVLNQLQPDKHSFLGSFEPPMWFGELGLFDGGQFSHDAYAHSPCHVLFLSRERVLGLLDEIPVLWAHLGRLQAMKLRLAYFLIDELSGMRTEERIARRLLAKAAGYGMKDEFSPVVLLRQEHLARSMGLARATVTPILQSWRRDAVVELGYGRIKLLNVPALLELAQYADWPDFYKESFHLPVDAAAMRLGL